MSLLIGVWIIAFLFLVGEVAIILYRSKDTETSLSAPTGFRDFISGEVFVVVRSVADSLQHFLPHGRRALFVVSVHGRRASDMFVKRIFGRMEIKRGNASSFFLKHLMEHQVTDRRNSVEKQGL